MKRKRGNSKKNKKKVKLSSEGGKSEEVIVESSNDDNDNDNGSGSGSSSSEEEIDTNEDSNKKNEKNSRDGDEKRDVATPVVAVTSEKPPPPRPAVVTVRPSGINSRPPPMAVYGRVRVKLKTGAKPVLPPAGPQPEKKVPLVQIRVGNSEGDKNKEEVKVSKEKKEDVGGSHVVGGVKVVEEDESGNLRSIESKKSGGGMGIKIVSSKSPGLSPSGGNGEGVSNRSEDDKIRQQVEVSMEKKEDVGGVGGEEKVVVEESGNSKSGGMGIKIVSSRGLGLSPTDGNDQGVSDRNKGDKSTQEVGVEKMEDGEGGGEKVEVERGKSGSVESKLSGGTGIKIASSKGSGLSPPVETGEGGKSRQEGSVEKKEDGSDGDKMVVGESGTWGSVEGKKSGGTGIKIVSLKDSGLSPPVGNAKEIGESKASPETEEEEGVNSGSAESKKPGGTGIKIVSFKGLGLSGNAKKSGESKVSIEREAVEGGDSGSAESKKFGGMGIKIVPSKDSGSSPPGGNAKGSSESKVPPEKEEEEGRNSGPAESKKVGGIGIKIVPSKDSGLSPSGGNAKESGESNVSPEKEEEEGGNSGSAESNKSVGTGIKTASLKGSNVSTPGRNDKESGESKVSSEKEEEKWEMMEVEVVEEKPKLLNKRELAASLEVVKKVMKMDAAEPFNTPVNPIELGIPDYFDVIKTPMDFGTVCNNLESGAKYMDSKDVYQDVQYIWDNCFTYNNKSDYIVDLMKRVKKNFMKYWVAAGLYTEQTKTIDSESNAVDDPATSGPGKKLKKGKGYKLHKEDCLCAICIMRRRRREREAREAQEAREAGVFFPPPQVRISQTSTSEAYKQEKENSHAESPGGYTSSYLETSPDGYADTEMEDGETGLEGIASQYGNQHKAEDDRMKFHDKSRDFSHNILRNDKGDSELYETNLQDDTGSRMMNDNQRQPSGRPEEPAYGYLQQRNELLELEKKRQRLRLLETFRDLENPMLSGLCSTLFPNKAQSVWNGPNSLLRGQRSHHQKNRFHEAVASFISPPSKSTSSLK